jgi:hypothetical protein
MAPEDLEEVLPVLQRCRDTRPLARYRSAGEMAGALGLSTGGHPHVSWRDCPICRLRAEIERDIESGGGYGGGPRFKGSASSYFWAVVAVLTAATVLVWWIAVR